MNLTLSADHRVFDGKVGGTKTVGVFQALLYLVFCLLLSDGYESSQMF